MPLAAPIEFTYNQGSANDNTSEHGLGAGNATYFGTAPRYYQMPAIAGGTMGMRPRTDVGTGQSSARQNLNFDSRYAQFTGIWLPLNVPSAACTPMLCRSNSAPCMDLLWNTNGTARIRDMDNTSVTFPAATNQAYLIQAAVDLGGGVAGAGRRKSRITRLSDGVVLMDREGTGQDLSNHTSTSYFYWGKGTQGSQDHAWDSVRVWDGAYEFLAPVGAAAAVERSSNEPVAISDALATSFARARAATDAVGIGDSLAAAAGRQRSSSDAVGLADQLAAVAQRARATADAVGLADALQVRAARPRGAADAVSIADQARATAERGRGVADAVGLSDEVSAAAQRARARDEQVAIADEVLVAGERGREADDDLEITDELTTAAGRDRGAGDDVALVDDLEVARALVREIADGIAMGDLVLEQRAGAGETSTGDAVGLLDQIEATRTLERHLDDAIGLSDNLQTALDHDGGPAADGVGIVDEVLVERSSVVLIEDTLAITDAAASVGDAVAVLVRVVDGVEVSVDLSVVGLAGATLTYWNGVEEIPVLAGDLARDPG